MSQIMVSIVRDSVEPHCKPIRCAPFKVSKDILRQIVEKDSRCRRIELIEGIVRVAAYDQLNDTMSQRFFERGDNLLPFLKECLEEWDQFFIQLNP